MTWMTPFDCMTLAMVIRALSPLASITHQPPPLLRERQVLAFDGLQHRLAAVPRRHRPRSAAAVIRPGTT